MLKKFRRTFLYLKTHNITGLKYFGKTIKDPHKYQGSGKYWRLHLAVHGRDVSTEVIGVYDDRKECINAAVEYSRAHDVANNEAFANLMLENGTDGAGSGEDNPMYGKKHSDEIRKKISERTKESLSNDEKRAKMRGRIVSDETRRKISEKARDRVLSEETRRKMSELMRKRRGEMHPMWGKRHSEETKRKMSERKKGANAPWFGKKGIDHPRFGKLHSDETRKKMAERKGMNHPFFGKRHSDDAKRRMSQSHMGKTISEETKRRMSEAKKGARGACIHCGAVHNADCKIRSLDKKE